MRIEFNAGLLNQFSISVFKEHSFRFEESVDTVREGFDNVINFICNMNGGVGILQDAVDLVRRRSDADRKKTENIHEARRKCADFLEEVKHTDREVAKKVRTNTKEFCKKYPHLVPKSQEVEKKKNWLDKAWDWVKGKAKDIYHWGKEKVKDVIDWAKKKGKEFLDKVISATTTVVDWLVEKGKNLYDGITDFLEFLYDNFVDFIDKNIEFWGSLLDKAAEAFINFVDWAGEKLADIGRKIGEICSAIGQFVSEHWRDLLDIVVGVVEVVAGIINAVAAIVEIVGSAGTLSPVAVLQLVGSVIAIEKGLERITTGVWGATDHTPTTAEKILFTPFKFIEDGLNDLVPGWHLGDVLGFCGDIVGIAGGVGELIEKGPTIIKVIGVTLDGISALAGFGSSLTTDNPNDDAAASGVSGGNAVYNTVTGILDLIKK